jgi:hypothetical protein
MLPRSEDGRVIPNRKVVIPIWEHVGRVDLTVGEFPGSPFDAGLIELKWSGAGSDKLYEGLWDAFKLSLALIANAVTGSRAYLLTGAKNAVWDSSPFADLFETNVHDPVELCRRRLANRTQTLAWDDLLRGGYDSHPHWVPGKIATTVCGRAAVSGSYELRGVEITVPECDGIGMTGGWPKGDRPAEAKHPKIAPSTETGEPQSKFDDTSDDIVFDPGTFPENVELMRQIDKNIERGKSAE